MFSNTLKEQVNKGERNGFKAIVRKVVDDVPQYYPSTTAIAVYPLDAHTPAYALYSYGQLVALYEPWDDCLKLYLDADGYEWSRSTMRHIVAFVHGYNPQCNCIADVRSIVSQRIPATNGERVRYDDKKKAWVVTHA